MTDQEFIILVKKMRDAQKSYFKNRLNRDLQESKALEKQVDHELSKITSGVTHLRKETTGNLF